MPSIEDSFREMRSAGRRGLMPFVVGGHPVGVRLEDLLVSLEAAGATAVEIGIPFSDPIADGPVIAAAMHEALSSGITPQHVMDEVASVRGRVGIPLIAMVSASIVHRLGGTSGFFTRAMESGFDGVIVPDMTLEESEPYVMAARDAGLALAMLVSPTTPPARAAALAKASTGFVYLLARGGITGESAETPDVERRVEMIREHTSIPIACGFGISKPEHVAAVVRHADAAIVGTALVRRLNGADRTSGGAISAAADFVSGLAAALDQRQRQVR